MALDTLKKTSSEEFQMVTAQVEESSKEETHIFQAPLSSERFKANVVAAMQKKKIIGVTSRYVIISKKNT